ncbi:unnamed protein product [Camellia sinensis]
MRTGYKEQPKNAWKTKGLALPTIFAIDEFFRHNEDTKWAVKELERRELVGLFGPFLKVYPCLVRLFYQNMHKQYRFPNVLYTVLDGVCCPLEEGPYQDLHGDLSPEAIVNDMCKGHFGSDHQSTCRVHLPPQMWLIDSIFHLSGHKDECQGHYLKAFYKIEKGYWVSVPDLIWAEMDKLHKGLVVTQTQKSESWALPFPSLITKLLLDQGFPIDTDEIVVNERVGMYACPSSCAYSTGTAPAPFQMTSEQYEQLCQEVRGLQQDVIAYRTQSQQDFLEFRSQYQQDMLDLQSLLQAILDAQQRPPRVSLRSLDDRVAIGLQEQEGKLNPTDGFTNIPLTESNFKLQKPYDIPLEQRCSFQNGVHRLWVYADDKPYDPSSPTQPRTEIRILGLDYSAGVWQFEGYGFVPNSTSGATIVQIHGATNYVTTIKLRIYNGDMRYYSGDLVDTDLYDKWFRVNLIHDVDKRNLTVFIDGVKKFETKDRGAGDFYFKCGVYAAPANTSYYMESRPI